MLLAGHDTFRCCSPGLRCSFLSHLDKSADRFKQPWGSPTESAVGETFLNSGEKRSPAQDDSCRRLNHCLEAAVDHQRFLECVSSSCCEHFVVQRLLACIVINAVIKVQDSNLFSSVVEDNALRHPRYLSRTLRPPRALSCRRHSGVDLCHQPDRC